MLTIQRVNSESKPPRFEWVASLPSFAKGEDSIAVDASWTADHTTAHDFADLTDAQDWAEALGANVVRFGDAPAQPVSSSPEVSEKERLAKIDERMEKRKAEAARVEAEATAEAAEALDAKDKEGK